MAKKTKSNLSTHSMRFADYVTKAQTDALKPFIHGTMNQLGQALARNQLAAMADVLTRTSVLENLATSRKFVRFTALGLASLGALFAGGTYAVPAGTATLIVAIVGLLFFTTPDKSKLAQKVLEIEDESTGFKGVSGPAKEGDMLRVTIQGRGEKDTQFGNPTPMRIRKLLREPYTINKEVEEALVGVKSGQSKIVPITVTNKVKNPKTEELEDRDFTYTFKVKVDRISVPLNPPAPTPEKEGETNA